MSIFEDLENLNVSEECFDDIMGIVESILEGEDNWEPAKYKNKWSVYDKTSCVYYPTNGGRKGAEKRCKELNTKYPEKPRIDLSYESLMEKIMGIVEKLILDEKLQDTIDKKYDLKPEKGQFYSKAYQEYKDAEEKGDPSAEEKYRKWDRGIRLSAKAQNIQAEAKKQKREEGRPVVDERTKGERKQRFADLTNKRYGGKNGIYIKDRRAEQDAENGYNIAINKAIRRHKGEK